jgi:Mrp family chromosome partitioning ATPase/capsular polysaccharide biosynthesis protein
VSAWEVGLNNAEPAILSSMWRHRWLVLQTVGVMFVLALAFQWFGSDEVRYEATTNLVIQEPMTPEDSTGAGITSNEQYIASQLEVLRSPVAAEAASEIANDAGHEVTVDDLAESVAIVGTAESPLVTITAEAASPEAAIAFANAIADGYRAVTQRQTTATAEAQLERIDAQLASIDQRLSVISNELSGLISGNPALESLRAQAQESISAIAVLQTELLTSTGDEAEELREQIADHRLRIEIYAEVVASSTAGPDQQALVEEQARQVDRRATLLTLRDEIAVDAGLAPDAIALVQPATEAERLDGVGLPRILAVAIVLGLAIGAALAYFLDLSRRTITRRSEPEALLGTQLLADVPDFGLEDLESVVPVRDHPRSAAAEAYRFAATSVIAKARSQGLTSILVASSTLGQGKTTTAVNMALAAAFNGQSVIVVDGDFGNQEASRILLGDAHMRDPGVTDVIDGKASTAEASHRVELGNGLTVSVMPRGTRPTLAASAFQSERGRALFESLTAGYDLVVIDCPPLLQVAYASMLAELSEGLVVVVQHGAREAELTDLRARLDLIGKPVLGYVYNRSPLRREMTMSEGSMMDILGDSGFEPETQGAQPPRLG